MNQVSSYSVQPCTRNCCVSRFLSRFKAFTLALLHTLLALRFLPFIGVADES